MKSERQFWTFAAGMMVLSVLFSVGLVAGIIWVAITVLRAMGVQI